MATYFKHIFMVINAVRFISFEGGATTCRLAISFDLYVYIYTFILKYNYYPITGKHILLLYVWFLCAIYSLTFHFIWMQS